MTRGRYRHHEIDEITYDLDQPNGAWLVFGGQAGSEGKGAIAGYLAQKYQWGAAITANMPNAGHTVMRTDGEQFVMRHLPVAAINPLVPYICIGPGAAIDPDVLAAEVTDLNLRGLDVRPRLRIHPSVPIIEARHRQFEKSLVAGIGSTGKGCGAVTAERVMRAPALMRACDHPILSAYVANTDEIVNDVLNSGKGVLVEGSQGFELDRDRGYWPYVTSRSTTPMQLCADVGIAGHMVRRSIAVVRTYPIRVASPSGGTSGPYGAPETSWAMVSARIGRPVEERTTVTGNVRRVFEIDLEGLRLMSRTCRPTDVALTFLDYLTPELQGASEIRDLYLSHEAQGFIWKLEQSMKRGTHAPRVRLIKTGPEHGHMIDLLPL